MRGRSFGKVVLLGGGNTELELLQRAFNGCGRTACTVFHNARAALHYLETVRVDVMVVDCLSIDMEIFNFLEQARKTPGSGACRIVVTLVVFWVLCRYVCQTTAMLLTKTNRELLLIGSLPLVYYIFDYATTKFSSLLYTGNRAVPEFLGFAICLSYLIFLLVYFREYEMKSKAEQYNELIRMQMNSFQAEMDNTRKSEKKMSILRHDTRHHMAVLRTLIQQGDCEKALEYLNEVSQTYDDTVIKAYCRNEMVNSVLSTYNTRFEEQKIPWDTQVTIGEKLPCSEMMFCAILSNVLENAMHAVTKLPEEKRIVHLSIFEKGNHLLILQKNPASETPVFSNGIPVTTAKNHGIGVQSVIYYVEKEHGQYQFYMEGEDFVVRIIL